MSTESTAGGKDQWVAWRHERLVVLIVTLAFVALSLGFSLSPIFEGLDETAHYRFIHQLVATGSLPDPSIAPKAQYHQAPLYYLLASPVLLVIKDADFPDIAPINRSFAYDIEATGNDNKNLRLHSRAEAFPYSASPTALAAHLLRLISIAIGVGTLLASYAIFRMLWPCHPDRRMAAFGFVAFWPQFVWLSSLVSNDNLLFLLATVSLLLVLRQSVGGVTWRSASILGIVLGLALLSKANAVFLAFPVGTAFLLDRKSWKFAPLTLLITLAIAGWWYVRNFVLYGDFSGMKLALDAWQGGPIPPQQRLESLARLPFVYQTFWARFGNTSIPVSQGLYLFFDFLTLASLLGLVLWVARGVIAWRAGEVNPRALRLVAVAAVFQLSWIASVIVGASIAWNANQGRYLLPGVAIWAAMITAGLQSWTPSRWRMPAALSGLALMAAVTLISLFGYFLPAFQPLPVPAKIDNPLSYRFEGVAELIGMSPPAPQASPGDTVIISLYWRAIQPTRTSLTAYLHSVDSDVVRRDSYPATGNLLSTEWLPGQMWAERYVVHIPAEALPGHYALIAGLYDPQSKHTLAATDSGGSRVTPVIGEIVISAKP